MGVEPVEIDELHIVAVMLGSEEGWSNPLAENMMSFTSACTAARAAVRRH